MSDPRPQDSLRTGEGATAGIALIALGGNLPWRGLFGEEMCAAALSALATAGVTVIRVSSVVRTPAWPDPRDPAFWNAAAQVAFGARAPEAALAVLLAVEARFGRERGAANAPRTLDLDLLDYGGLVRAGPDPILPHPRMVDRRFVLEPLAEIAPDWIHPALGRTARDLVAAMEDKDRPRQG